MFLGDSCEWFFRLSRDCDPQVYDHRSKVTQSSLSLRNSSVMRPPWLCSGNARASSLWAMEAGLLRDAQRQNRGSLRKLSWGHSPWLQALITRWHQAETQQTVVTKVSWGVGGGSLCESVLVNEHACASGRVCVAGTLRQSCIRAAFQNLPWCVYFSLVLTRMTPFWLLINPVT